MKVKGKVLAALVGIVLLAVLGVVIPVRAYRQVVAAGEARRHSNEVVKGANDLLSELKDAETGERGYSLTGDPAFLEPYNSARPRIQSDLETLLRITTNSLAREHLEAMVPLIESRMKELASMIRVVDSGDRAAARAYIGGGTGKRLMDAVRVEMATFIQIKETELAAQEVIFQSQMRILFVVIAVGSVLGLSVAVLLAYLIYRGAQNRLKDEIHLETSRLLEIQRETSGHLQRANDSLQASEERLAVIVRSIGDGLLATDAKGRIVFLNPVAEQLTGWTQAEAAGLPVDEVFNIVNQETRKPCVVPVTATLEHGTIQGLANHTLLIARDGCEHPIADSCAPMRDHNHVVTGAVLVFRDVTNEYAAQKAIQQSNQELQGAMLAAEKANLAKSDFLSSMSHELRSPLNAILGFAQLMESSTPPPSPAQAGRINQILQAGWHLLNLINEILDLAVIESGKVSLSIEPVSVPEIMSECRAMMEPQAQKRGIVMVFPESHGPVYVRADRIRLKQIIINLLSNAIKYNKEFGTVTVECRPVAPGILRISVADTGLGLKPEKLAQLFQPFNRLGQEATGVAGTGIGLVVTKRLAELIEGALGVESTVGVGSVFWVELKSSAPVELLQGDFKPATQAQWPADAKQRTLLYVEDNPANMMLVEELVARKPNLRLLTAVNGSLGIEMARASLPDLILMDINLPGISGLEAMRRLRNDPVTAHIPVVALSANAMERDVEKGLAAGFFRYITKPIKVNEFMDTLNVALEFAEGKAPKPGTLSPIL